MHLSQDRERCLARLVWAAQQLQLQVDTPRLAKVSELIVQSMTGPWRYFHTPNHTFAVGGSQDAIEVIAALFHDLIYLQIDQSVSVNLSCYIAPFVKEIAGRLYIRDQSEIASDFAFELVSSVFGFVPGQVLSPVSGQNEFLSALAASKILGSFCPPQLLTQVVACIEMTIPFRPKLATGISASEDLYHRLTKANSKLKLNMTEPDLVQAVKRSVRMANRDIENFAYPSAASFLDNTWKLIPETNHHLNRPSSYTVHEYRVALQKMEGFMNFLKPERIFQQFQSEPDDQTYRGLLVRSKRNIRIAQHYLGVKLVAIAILEALSLRLGHDIPLSMMMGELPNLESSNARFENFLPILSDSDSCPLETELEAEVLKLLEKGRSNNSSYDLKNSPLAAFIVKSLGFSETRLLLKRAKKFFQGSISAEEFLSGCDAIITTTITEAVLQLFESRKLALLKVA